MKLTSILGTLVLISSLGFATNADASSGGGGAGGSGGAGGIGGVASGGGGSGGTANGGGDTGGTSVSDGGSSSATDPPCDACSDTTPTSSVDGSSQEDGGCSCRWGSAPSGAGGALALLAAMMFIARRNRTNG